MPILSCAGAAGHYESQRAPRQRAGELRRAVARGMLGHVVRLGRGPAAGMAAAELYAVSPRSRGHTDKIMCLLSRLARDVKEIFATI